MLKIITDQIGKKGFIIDNTFITNPFYREDLGVEVDPIEYYGLTDDQLTQFENLRPEPEEPEPKYEELVKKLKGMSFLLFVGVEMKVVLAHKLLKILSNFSMNMYMIMILLRT